MTRTDAGAFRDTAYFEVAGPTVIATNCEIRPEDPLRSRCIKITMPEARGVYSNITAEDLRPVRARLLAWRAWHLTDGLVEVAKPVPGRLGDLMQPLLSVAALLPEETTKALLRLVHDMEGDRRRAESETLAGKIVEALDSLRGEVVGGLLPTERLREVLNEDQQERYAWSPQRIGRELSALGFERKKTMGKVHIVMDEELLEKLKKRFVGETSLSSLNSLPLEKSSTYAREEREIREDRQKNLPDITLGNHSRREDREEREISSSDQDSFSFKEVVI